MLSIFPGQGWAQPVEVQGSRSGDILVLALKPTDNTAPAVVLASKRIPDNGVTVIEVAGPDTAKLRTGRHMVQFALLRGDRAGVFEAALSVAVRESIVGSLGAGLPLFAPTGEPLALVATEAERDQIMLTASVWSGEVSTGGVDLIALQDRVDGFDRMDDFSLLFENGLI